MSATQPRPRACQAAVRRHRRCATIYIKQGETNKAIAQYKQALALNTNDAAVHLDLGWLCHEHGQSAEALAHIEAAVRLRPHWGKARVHLATVLEARGENAAALEALREAVARDPDYPDAWAHLAELLRGSLPPDDEEAIRRLLGSPLPPDKRVHLHFGLGAVHDARGEYAAAADQLRRANRHRHAAMRKLYPHYRPANHRWFVDAMRTTFTARLFARTRGFGRATERPVFIVGLPRSGTTLTEQILASHPDVFGGGEMTVVAQTFDAVPRLMKRADLPFACLRDIDHATVQQLAGRLLDEQAGHNATARRFVDKMPDNYLYLGLIAILFPRAKIIHCRRDLRDTALSCWMTNFAHVPWTSDISFIASRFGQYRRLMDHWGKVLPVPVLDVDYEQTVADVEGAARRLVAWCGLEWDPACLEFYKTRRSVATASASQVRRPVYTSSVGRWRKYDPWLKRLFAKL
jgi:tetratricopeptide (TPR) repeat protein